MPDDLQSAAAPKVLVVLPALDEAERIAPIVRELRTHLPGARVLVVDDASSDATAERARGAGAAVARLPFHLGYGGALQTGYKIAVADGVDFLVQMDADGQHRPADAPALLAAVTDGSCDLAIGSRFLGHPRRGTDSSHRYRMGRVRSLGRRTLCLLARLGGLRITDPTSGFQAMNRRALNLFATSLYPADYPDVDVLLLAHRRGLRLRELPVDMAPSPRRSLLHSGWLPIYYAYRMVLSLWALGAVPRRDFADADDRTGDRAIVEKET
jgi:glycosyltransferase involved in cell wall biosynthesis